MDSPSNEPPPLYSRKRQLITFLFVQLIVLVGFFLVMLDFGNYGWTLFMIIPFSIGLTIGYYTKTFGSKSALKGFAITLLVLAVVSGLMIVAGMEGAICILMAEGLIALPALVGLAIGFLIRNMYKTYMIAFVLLLNTSFTWYDAVDTDIIESTATETVTVRASREELWTLLTGQVNFAAHDNLFFKAGVSYPTSMQLTRNDQGCFLSCRLNNGFANLKVTELDTLGRIRFTIPDDVETLRELTPYSSLDAPHLKGYFHAFYGEFAISSSNEKECTLTATTQYSYRLTPSFYWRWWSDYLVNTMHRHVLNEIKAQAEK